MDFASVILFQILYYLRPQEWPIGLGAVHFVQIAMLTGLASLSLRERGFSFRDVFRTPHDWAMLAFWLWIVFSSPTRWETFKETASYYLLYVLIVQTLYSIPRLSRFVGWWTYLICAVALLALAQMHGFDPLDSLDLTNGPMKGRLALNLSIFNNPNALGHSIVPAFPLLYYFCIWKKNVFHRVLGVGLLILTAYCILLTQSKGAFLAGGATLLATLTFGRPKFVQTSIICGALLFGGAALSLLPRMEELNKTKSDPAIQGRVIAFRHGFKMIQTNNYGVGYHKWGDSFLAAKYRYKRTKFDKESLKRPMPIIFKASHSSFVCIGAELGYPGFFLHMGILYCCLRTLITAKTATPDEERIRRILFALIVSYAVSSWMVNFEYRSTFFMFAAATAALHRHLQRLNEQKDSQIEGADGRLLQPAVPAWRARLLPQPALEGAFAQMGAQVKVLSLESPLAATPAPQPEPAAQPVSGIGFAWNRIGLVDLALTLAMTYAAVRYWSYLLTQV